MVMYICNVGIAARGYVLSPNILLGTVPDSSRCPYDLIIWFDSSSSEPKQLQVSQNRSSCY